LIDIQLATLVLRLLDEPAETHSASRDKRTRHMGD